jgi:adenylosuccinate lyase
VLLALARQGMSRDHAYAAVQRSAMRVWAGEGSLRDLLGADPEVTSRLSAADLDACFDPGHTLRHVDAVYRRLFPAL